MQVEINGNRLNLELLGDNPSAPVMICHHGAPGLSSLAEPKAAFSAFADRYRVIVFDARGSGESEGKPPFTHAQWAADVDALRHWAGVETIVMAGGSYGGFIAMEYALRYPGRVEALVLRDTSADSDFHATAMANALASARVRIDRAKLDRIMAGSCRDNADFKDCWREILPLYDHHFDPAKIAERVEAVTYRYETHNFAFTHNLPNYDLKPELHRIACPTLVTVGRHDWITPVACSERIAALIPNARLEIFEASGHSPQIEEAAKFRRVVGEFLAEHAAGG